MKHTKFLAYAALAGVLNFGSATAEPGGKLDPLLLSHPETAFGAQTSGEANFVESIDQKVLSYSSPEIVFQKSGAEADFIVGVWRDSQGKVVHQREVLIVKPDYGVVVDYLLGWKGNHEVACAIGIPSGGSVADTGSNPAVGAGELAIQRLGLAKPAPASEAASGPAGTHALAQTGPITLPAPIAWAFSRNQSGAPKFEPIQAANPMVVKCRVTLPGGSIDEVGIAWEFRDQLHLGGKVLKGWAAIARKGPGAGTDIEIKQAN